MQFKRVALFVLLLGLLALSVFPATAQVDEPLIADYMTNLPQGWGALGAEALFTEIIEGNELFLLDVREPNELEEDGYILGAVNVPTRSVAQNLDMLPADLDAPIVVYCKAGTRGAIVMSALQILGYTNVRNLSGGIGAWVGEEYEVITEPYVAPEPGEAAPIDEALVASVDDYLVNALPQGWGIVRSDALFTELLEGPEPFILDVREQAELDELGYIEGAYHIPLREVGTRIDEIPADQPIVIYCKKGHRGAIAMVALQMLGYEARNLAGGITGWLSAGYETVGAVEQVEEFDFAQYMADYTANLPQGWGALGAEALFTEIIEGNELFLLDVREPNELEEDGYILGAVNVPVRSVAQNLDLLPADLDAPIVVYCKAGTRGAIVMSALQVLGYSNVRNLSGGIGAWVGQEYEVITEPYVAPEPGEAAPVGAELLSLVDDYLVNVLPQGWGIVRSDALFTELLENPPFLLDVREQSELDELGYIEGAYHIPLREVGARVSELPTDTPIVIYCKKGHRGAIAMVTLQMLGYEARNLAGGITGWLSAGYETVGAVEAEVAPVEVVLPEGELLDAEVVEPVVLESISEIAFSDGFGTITGDTLTGMMGDVFILDVREVGEYEGGFIPGAVNVPLREVAQNLNLMPDLDAPIVIYCAGGHRGAIAHMALDMLGYTNLLSLRGGLNGWNGELTNEVPDVVGGEFPAVGADLWATVDAYLAGIPAGFGTISAENLNIALAEEAPFILDVREPTEFANGFIAGAVNVPMREFTLDGVPMDVQVVTVGSIGHRGAVVMTGLQMLGYDAANLNGGLGAWEGGGYELVTE